MTESKVSIDEAFKHFTNTLNTHSESIQRIDQSLTALQLDHNTQIPLLQTSRRDDLQSVEQNLSTRFATKTDVITIVTEELRLLKAEIKELQTLFLDQIASQAQGITTSDSPNIRAPDATSTPTPPILQSRQIPTLSSTTVLHDPSPSTIVLPPTSSTPTFSGKPTDRPRQFLLRIEEYTQTVNHWSRQTLLRGISQYLRDDALEWYCQLHSLQQLPHTWEEFVTRFLVQFHSPLRAAQQEQAWTTCKQTDNETINQFVVRLRSLWLEQKSDETEADFTKHLFCKMRPDMLSLMNFSHSSSLDAIILEAQKVEEILFLRNKEQNQREVRLPTASPHVSSISSSNLPQLMSQSNHYRPLPEMSQQRKPSVVRQPRPPITCWRCYETGHYSSHCPLNENNLATQPLPPRRKNE